MYWKKVNYKSGRSLFAISCIGKQFLDNYLFFPSLNIYRCNKQQQLINSING